MSTFSAHRDYVDETGRDCRLEVVSNTSSSYVTVNFYHVSRAGTYMGQPQEDEVSLVKDVVMTAEEYAMLAEIYGKFPEKHKWEEAR